MEKVKSCWSFEHVDSGVEMVPGHGDEVGDGQTMRAGSNIYSTVDDLASSCKLILRELAITIMFTMPLLSYLMLLMLLHLIAGLRADDYTLVE